MLDMLVLSIIITSDENNLGYSNAINRPGYNFAITDLSKEAMTLDYIRLVSS